MTNLADFSDSFAACRTPAEAGTVYQNLYREHVGGITAPMAQAYQPLSEAYRRSLERMSSEAKIESRPHDPNRVRPHELRNWCAQQGIPLARKGKVSVIVENQYREAHGMDLLEVKSKVAVPERPSGGGAAVDSKTVRAWAQSNGITVGSRGRIHPDVVAKYLTEVGA